MVLQKTPISFDAAQWEILAPGLGATVVTGGPGLYRDPERLIETIAAHGVTTLQCVPTLLSALLEIEEFAACTSLTQIFSGGEALSRALAVRCLRALPGCELTETTWFPDHARFVRSGPQGSLCRVCYAPARRAYAPLGLPVHRFSELVPPDERRRIDALAMALSPAEMEKLEQDGIGVG